MTGLGQNFKLYGQAQTKESRPAKNFGQAQTHVGGPWKARELHNNISLKNHKHMSLYDKNVKMKNLNS